MITFGDSSGPLEKTIELHTGAMAASTHSPYDQAAQYCLAGRALELSQIHLSASCDKTWLVALIVARVQELHECMEIDK